MSDADDVNRAIEAGAPALGRALSERGRSLVFPKGIPYQAAQASDAEINATIGQLTDGHGAPLPLRPIQDCLSGLDPATAWLYASVSGPVGIRKRWVERQKRLGNSPDVTTDIPVATHGLTHAVQLIASLIADENLEVVLPRPAWGNYRLIFRLAGTTRVRTYDFFDENGGFNLAGLEAQLDAVSGKALVVLNFPNNPTGYAPTPGEADAITDMLAARRGTLVVAVDDAYQGWVYDEARERASIFWRLARKANPEYLQLFKIDGATKELAFFSSRVGFVTSTLEGAASEALESKLKCAIRGSVGSVSGPALAIVGRALDAPDLEEAFEERRQMMAERCAALRRGLEALDSPRLRPLPFHGAFFAVAQVAEPEALRRRLLEQHSTGVIAFADDGLIRLAYCSLALDAIPELVARIGKALG